MQGSLFEARSAEYERTNVVRGLYECSPSRSDRDQKAGTYLYIYTTPALQKYRFMFVSLELIEETGRFRVLIFGISGQIFRTTNKLMFLVEIFQSSPNNDEISGYEFGNYHHDLHGDNYGKSTLRITCPIGLSVP